MDIDECIRTAAGEIPGIAVLAVFGSRARGDARRDSDLDVAVLPELSQGASRRRLRTDLAVALADLAPEGRVDVVLLDEAPDVLRQRVMEHGRVLINRDPAAWADLRVRTLREYGDREHVRQIYEQAQRRRLERGETSGRSPKALESLGRVGRLPH
jgi:hypothetical protein